MADFNLMLEVQAGNCGICQQPLDMDQNSRGRVNVDHNHETGKVRQLLCHPCNTMLGAVESPGFLKKALAYLKKHGTDPLEGS